MSTTTEIEFLIQVLHNHSNALDEQTTHSILEFFVYVYLHHPFVANAMGLGGQIARIVEQNKETSTEICNYVEGILVPQILAQMLALKKEEQDKISRSPMKQPRLKKPMPGSKGHNLLQRKEKEAELDLKMKRYNIINLVERLHRALEETKYQDTIVQQVQESEERYRAAFRQPSGGLKHLLSKWGAATPSKPLVPAMM